MVVLAIKLAGANAADHCCWFWDWNTVAVSTGPMWTVNNVTEQSSRPLRCPYTFWTDHDCTRGMNNSTRLPLCLLRTQRMNNHQSNEKCGAYNTRAVSLCVFCGVTYPRLTNHPKRFLVLLNLMHPRSPKNMLKRVFRRRSRRGFGPRALLSLIL